MTIARMVLPVAVRDDRRILAAVLAALAAIALVAALATARGLLVPALGAAIALPVLLVSLRRPLLPLFAYALLVPIEEALVLGPLGTVSRFAALLFIVAYAVPRIARLGVGVMPVGGWAFVGWACLSIGWAIDPAVTSAEIQVLVLLFVTAVLIGTVVVDRPAVVGRLLWCYSVSAAATAVIGTAIFLTGGTTGAAAGERAAGLPNQDPAHFAALLIPALLFALHQLMAGRLVALSLPVAGLTTVGILLSGTRGAWLAVALVLVLFVLPRLSRGRRLVALATATVAVVLALQLPGVGALVSQRVDTAVSSGGAGRTDIWAVGATIYASSPVTGVGLANFPIAYTDEAVRESAVGPGAAFRGVERAPHSLAVGTLGELGVVGFLLILLFLVPLVVRRGWGPDAAAVQAILAALLIDALFLDLLNRKQVWLVIGLACGLLYLAHRQRVLALNPAPEPAT